MAGYQQYSNTAWERTAHTTLVQHMTDVEETMLRNFPFFALLDSSGRIDYNESGSGFDWPVQNKLHAVQGNNGETPRSFQRRNLWTTAHLEFRGYHATDQMFRKEFLENRGPEAIVKVFDRMTERLEQSMKQALSTEVYADGNAVGNEDSWHGLETMFALNGTVNAGDGAQRAANAADIVGYPSGTYAGLSTELGNYGGSNVEGVWPNGKADPQYDFWSPIVVNYTSTHADMPASTNTFAAQGDEAMRYAIIQTQRNSSQDGQVDAVFLARNLYGAFLNLIDDKEQIHVMGGAQTPLRALGFKNVVYFDGIEVTWDTGIANGIGYGLNVQNISLKSMEDRLLAVEGPEYDIDDQSYKCVVSTLSNLKFKSPRNFFKLAPLA
jgi:hypothetical protein